MLFTMNDLMLGVLIASVVLMVKSLPMLMARISLGYLTHYWIRGRRGSIANARRDVELISSHFERTIDLIVEPDNRLAAYKGILDSLKKNVGLYDEAVAASLILALFFLGGYFDADVEPMIAALVLVTLILSAVFYWAQVHLVELLNWEILLRVRGQSSD